MNPVFINVIRIISAAAKNSANLLELTKGDKFTENNFGKNTFEIGVSSSKIRKCPRYAKIAVAEANSALFDANFTDSIDKTRGCTIFSTGYEGVESTINGRRPLAVQSYVFSCIKMQRIVKGVDVVQQSFNGQIISEGAVLFSLSRQENLNSYRKITKFSSMSLENIRTFIKLANRLSQVS